MKVLYIAGNGRSGSTLLDVILGQFPGFFPVGEVRNVWDYGLVENRPCGCGQPFRDCGVWSGIFEGEFTGARAVDPVQVAAWRERFAQTKRLVPMVLRPGTYTGQPAHQLDRYLGVLERLYGAIARQTGASVIVDSSKWPTYAFLLDRLPSIDLYVLHLVRDPRACAFSWTRRREGEPGRFLDTQHPARSTIYWTVWNAAIRHFWSRRTGRYMLLRYEDFAASPRDSVRRILEFVGEPAGTTPFVDDHTVTVSKTHAIEGNITRFLSGAVTIRADREWEARMPARDRMLVTLMTWPFLRTYGYS